MFCTLILIFPSVICSLYSIVNESSWFFDSTISQCNGILFFYSILIDALYGKFCLLWLLQRVVKDSYRKHDELLDEMMEQQVKLYRCFSPLPMSILFGVLLSFLHWSMLTIIGIQIYTDNSSIKSENGHIVANNYKSTSFTRLMIFCCAYLPIAS